MGCSVPAVAQGVPAGTIINGTATASFTNSAGPQTITSNPIQVVVNEVIALTLTSVDAGTINADGSAAVLAFEVTNIGNGPEAFRLHPNTAVPGNDFDLTVERLVLDANGNAQFDPDLDTFLPAPATLPELASGEMRIVFVETSVPNGVPLDGETSQLELRAEALTGIGTPGTLIAGGGQAGSDAIIGSGSGSAQVSGFVSNGRPAVSLTKSAQVADPFGGTSPIPGAFITYSILASITGGGEVEELIVSDAIPEGTAYMPGTLALDNVPLTDTAGDDGGEATSTSVAFTFERVPAGTNHTLSFQVMID